MCVTQLLKDIPQEGVGEHLVSLNLSNDSLHDVPNLGSLGCNILQSSHANEAEVYIEPSHRRVVLSSLNFVGVFINNTCPKMKNTC